MSKSVWIVSEDYGYEGLQFRGAFSSRRKMVAAIEKRYMDVEIFDDFSYAVCYEDKRYVALSLDKRKVDKWLTF